MSQYVIKCSRKLLDTTTLIEAKQIDVEENHSLLFYDSKNLVLKNDSGNFVYIENRGRGNVLGGYVAKVTNATSSTSNNVTTRTLTLEVPRGLESIYGYEDLDFEKLSVGKTIRINCSGKAVEIDGVEEDTAYLESSIISVDAENNKITISDWVYPGTSEIREIDGSGFDSEVSDGKVFLWVDDKENIETCRSDNDKNFITGVRTSASGSWNTVVGITSRADGSMNIVNGNISYANGSYNIVCADSAVAIGVGNKISSAGTMSYVVGTGNEIKSFGVLAIGSGNRTKEEAGVNGFFIGNQNTCNGNNSYVFGIGNEAAADNQFFFGSRLKSESKKSMMIGAYGILENTKDNEYAVAVCGGEHGKETVSFLHRHRKTNELDPEESSEVYFSHQYRGRLKPFVLSISDVGNVFLDHDQYEKWELTGNGSVLLVLENWENGDYGEIVVNTSNTTISYPNEWITSQDFASGLSSGGIQVICIRKEGIGNVYKIFAHLAY